MMIESGKHVLCEKPLCINVDETNKLCSLAQKKSLFLMEVSFFGIKLSFYVRVSKSKHYPIYYQLLGNY